MRAGSLGRALRKGESNQRSERPLNSLLNMGYWLAEAEARLALLVVGLGPGLGLLHADYPGRDALALDLLEPARPAVERYVLRLVRERRFRKAEFTETSDGHVRLLAPLSHALIEMMPAWAEVVAPHVEAVVHALAELVPGRIVKCTPLTSSRRKAAQRRARPSLRRQASFRVSPDTCGARANVVEEEAQPCSPTAAGRLTALGPR
jgi:hypothetical protein